MSNKIPSLFRVAKNKRFNYEPWYYDPVKEEIRERENRIKREMQLDKGEIPEGYIEHASNNIRGAFRRGSTAKRDKAGMIRAFIFLILVGGLVSFWYLGKDSVYLLLVFIPIYFLVKKSKFFKS